MNRGFLSQYFEGVAVKRLSSVEVDPIRSNQHEFNGSKPLRNLLGEERLANYPCRFMWLGGESEGITEDCFVTWYDAREKHPNRTEFRLYFKSNPVMNCAKVGDLIIVAKRPSEELYIIVVQENSTLEHQLLWLFGINTGVSTDFNFQSIDDDHNHEIDFAVRYILEELGIEVAEPDTEFLDAILKPYYTIGFPSTAEFSSLARRIATNVSPEEDPDYALLLWMEYEEKLFKRLERHIVSQKLEGFLSEGTTKVESFLNFSLSVHNRRKSRVGYALENHLEEIFIRNEVKYSRNKITENKSRPDFLFPDIQNYHDKTYPSSRLTMLGVKSTCKDRWRQVLTEAARISTKHLFTLEPSISENQTDEMQANNLQLVLPSQLHETYKPNQKEWLMNLHSFIQLLKKHQFGT